MLTDDPKYEYKTIYYGNCKIEWSEKYQMWQAWYRGEVLFYDIGTKSCIDYVRKLRIAGELTIDAYREERKAWRAGHAVSKRS